MKIRVCQTLVEPRFSLQPSKSEPALVHYVIPSTIFNDPICDCLGYHFNASCRHIKEVEEMRCNWWSKNLDYNGLCPNCGAGTREFELDPEYQ